MIDFVMAAHRLAELYHAGQTDKTGAPYLGHVLRVADRVTGAEERATALLHDILEDTDATVEDLAAAGIPATVIEAVVLLTKTGGPNADYYARLRTNALARTVKLADVADNADPARLALLDDTTRDRLERKYAKAIKALT